jgi:hypothetical protein
VSEKRKDQERRTAEAAKAQPMRKQQPQPKKNDEEFDEQALDDVLRECPL